jgi:Phosphotransferase enzyme family
LSGVWVVWSATGMGIDQFFSFGPEVPFRANQVFTNREQQIQVFHDRFVEHGQRMWPVPELLDFQRAAANVIAVAGEGGIGKSTLARHVAELAVRGKLHSLPDNRAHAVVDFADPSSSDFESVLIRVRASLGRLARSWPAFDVALAVYWERKHPGESLTAFLKRSSAAESVRMSEQISSTVDQLLGGFGAISVAYRVLDMLGRSAAQNVRLRRLRQELPALDPILGEQDPDRMLGYMPVLLAADLERVRAKKPALALCVLDTVENLQALPAERGGLEDLVSRLVYLMPNVVFVAASRRPLRWHDPVRGVGLTYGGQRRWPGLAGADQLGLGGFDRVAAGAYLMARLTIDDRPAIEAPIRERIIAGSAGSPLYLDLSAGLYEQYLARRETPPAEAFGLVFPELVLRVMRDLPEQDRDLLRAAALLEAFDEDILLAVVPQTRRRHVETFLTRAFVRHDRTVWPPYRLHESLRKSVTDCDAHTSDGWTAAERREHVLRAIEYLAQVAVEVWDERPDHPVPLAVRSQRSAAAFLLALRAADEHRVLSKVLGDMAYTLSVLGHSQVLASLPDLPGSPEVARLTAVGRLTARGDLNAHDRYHAMRQITGDAPAGPFADYYRYELGTRAHIVGRLDEAIAYLSAVDPGASLIGAGALFGMADNALRRSNYREVARLMEQASSASLDQVRVADMLGHTYLHNARFAEAAALFESTLDQARAANAPLWEARAIRHLAQALMWFDPDRTLQLVPYARDLNASAGELIGVAQCDLAASLAHALRGEHQRAAELLDAARCRFAELGATRELLPVEVVQVLQATAAGAREEAAGIARRLAEAAARGRPECLPVWVAVTALLAGLGDLVEFQGIGWLETPQVTRQRWLEPLRRLGRGGAAVGTVCGRLDVDDVDAVISTGPIPEVDLKISVQAALASPAFDGDDTPVANSVGAFYGRRTVIKLQHRRHERLQTVRRFEQLRGQAGLRAPRLLDAGTVDSSSGEIWWAVLERLPGEPCERPTPGRQRALGEQLRRWHSCELGEGLRLDDPGALGVLLGWARATVPRAYPALAERFSHACAGLPVAPIHGDVAVGHNALFDADTLTAILDPGAVETGPPMLDLAWALAVDMPRGGMPGALIEGYGPDRVDRAALDAVLPLMMVRRLIDTFALGLADTDGRWIAHWLRERRPDLLDLVAGELGI